MQFTGVNNVKLLLKLRKEITDLINEEHSFVSGYMHLGLVICAVHRDEQCETVIET